MKQENDQKGEKRDKLNEDLPGKGKGKKKRKRPKSFLGETFISKGKSGSKSRQNDKNQVNSLF